MNTPFTQLIPSNWMSEPNPDSIILGYVLRLEEALLDRPKPPGSWCNLLTALAALDRSQLGSQSLGGAHDLPTLIDRGRQAADRLSSSQILEATSLFRISDWLEQAELLDTSFDRQSEHETRIQAECLLRSWDDVSLLLASNNHRHAPVGDLGRYVDECDSWQRSHLSCFMPAIDVAHDALAAFRPDVPAYLAWTCRKFVRVVCAVHEEDACDLNVANRSESSSSLQLSPDILATIGNWRLQSLTSMRLAASTDQFPAPAWSITWENPSRSHIARLRMPRSVDQTGEVRLGFFWPQAPQKVAYDLVGATVWLDGIESRIELIEQPSLAAVARFQVGDLHKQTSKALWLEVEGTPWLPADFQTPHVE